MGDVPAKKELADEFPPLPTTGEKVLGAIDQAQAEAHYQLTGGNPGLSPRRAALYVVVGVGVTLGWPVLALVPLILLALTEAPWIESYLP